MKKLKLIIPVLAVIVAVTGAFATQRLSAKDALLLDQTSTMNYAPCTIDGTCDGVGTSYCQSVDGNYHYLINAGGPPKTCNFHARGNYVP